MKIETDVSLKPYNTFGIAARAAHFARVDSVEALQEVLRQWSGSAPFILGGGSNLLLTHDLSGLVLLNVLRGREVLPETENTVLLRAGGGENWHELVQWSLEQGLGGLENLSLIPGTAGAAPIQNIGAYGVELSEVFHRLQAVELSSGRTVYFSREDCAFGYRDSLFKGAAKGLYCITEIELRLTRREHRINSSYGAIQDLLAERGIAEPSPQDISEAVIAIRQSKLPDPAQIGNSGSFFKNPEIAPDRWAALRQQFPDMPGYPLPSGLVKVPAGWLIERAGWKGKRIGQVGTYHKQALVLVNHGQATGAEVWAFAERIMEAVQAEFGIALEVEVNLV